MYIHVNILIDNFFLSHISLTSPFQSTDTWIAKDLFIGLRTTRANWSTGTSQNQATGIETIILRTMCSDCLDGQVEILNP